MWHDGGFADADGITTAIWTAAAPTAASGLIVAVAVADRSGDGSVDGVAQPVPQLQCRR
jgi:hypothetical protein